MRTSSVVAALLLCAVPLAAQTWETRAEMPTPRAAASSVVLDDKVYVIGGRVDDSEGLSAVEVYDPQADSWTRRADMTTPRGELAVAAHDGLIYTFGGAVTPVGGVDHLQVVEVYDPVADQWAGLAPMPFRSLGSTAHTVGDRIYVIGGFSWPDFQSAWEYDPIQDAWTQLGDMDIPRTLHSSGVVDNRIIAAGGSGPGDVGKLPSVFAFDLVARTWSRGANMPTGRRGLAGAVVAEAFYAIGGERDEQVLDLVEKYNPQTDTWTAAPSLKLSRRYATSAVVDGTILVIGGSDGRAALGSVEALRLHEPSTAVHSTSWATLKADVFFRETRR